MINCTYLMKRLITPNNVILPCSCTYFIFPLCDSSQQIFGSMPVLWVLNTERSLRQSKISPCNNRSLLVAYACRPVVGNPCRTANGSLSCDSVPGMVWLVREGHTRHTGPARYAFSCFLLSSLLCTP
jgi:hypothetical protein